MSRQLYFPDTAMLITRFMTKDGVGEVLDFMPVIEGAPTDRHRLAGPVHLPGTLAGDGQPLGDDPEAADL